MQALFSTLKLINHSQNPLISFDIKFSFKRLNATGYRFWLLVQTTKKLKKVS